MTGFAVRSSERIADTGFLAVDVLEIDEPGGSTIRRTVVRHPGAVVIVPVESDGATAIMVRQYRAAIGTTLLEAPAGKRDVDGEPPEATAARELEEEIGFLPGRLVKLAEFYNTPGFCDEYTYLFAALELSDVGRPNPVSPEERAMTVERVRLCDVERLVAGRELVDAKSIIGLLLARSLLAAEHVGIPG